MSDDKLRPDGEVDHEREQANDNNDHDHRSHDDDAETYVMYLLRRGDDPAYDDDLINLMPRDPTRALDADQLRVQGEYCHELAVVNTKDELAVERLGIEQRLGGPPPHHDDLRQMASDMRDFQLLQRIGVNAFAGRDERARRIIRELAERARTREPKAASVVERDRSRVVGALERFFAARPDDLDLGACVDDQPHLLAFLDELVAIDLRFHLDDILPALEEAMDRGNAIHRSAAKVSIAIDAFGDRTRFRCADCMDTVTRCKTCSDQWSDPVTLVENAYSSARKKHPTR